MRALWVAIAGAGAIAVLAPAAAQSQAPGLAAMPLAAAFKTLCIDSALSLDRLRAAWSATAKDGAPLTERPIDGVTPHPQARPGAPKARAPAPAEPRIRLDGKLALDDARYEIAAVAPKGGDRLDACRIEATLQDIDTGHEAVVTSLGLAEPEVIAASQSSTYLDDPDPTIFKYVRYAPLGPVSVTIGLELKPHGRGNLLLIAEPAAGR